MADHAILIVSNGYGEDAVGNALASALHGRGGDVRAFPLVGLGQSYRNVPLLDPRQTLPSGGFAFRGSWRLMLAELRAGAGRLWRQQRHALRQRRGHHSRIVAIGDAYGLWMAAHAGAPVVFIATANSEYHDPFGWMARYVIRRYASVTYARDQLTVNALLNHGINALYVGNPLMDVIEAGQLPPRPVPVVVLLPGSRNDAAKNLTTLLQLCAALRRTGPIAFICALPATLTREAVQRAIYPTGWQERDGTLESEQTQVLISRSFGPAVRAADVVVGLAGTANEQAAGLGKPVVAFPVAGAQYTTRFMRLQHRLLGDALVATPDWQHAASTVQRLLDDPAERARRGRIGQERMGEPGAVRHIADALLN